MTLSELFESKFRGDIRFRGAAYLQAERVAVTHVTPDCLFGTVRDGVEYQTQLLRDNGSLKLACSCAGSPGAPPNCKHLWATILATEAGNYLSGAVKPGFIPPFSVEHDEPLEFDDDEDWDDDGPSDLILGSAGAARPIVRTRPVAPPAPSTPKAEWEQRLLELKRTLADEEGAGGAAGKELELFYEIDAQASEAAGQLVVQTSQRQRRSNGDWGKLKPLKLRPGRFDDVPDEEDRRILAHLVGGAPDRSQNPTVPAGDNSATHRYRVPHDLALLILPTMCATGRMRWVGDEERVSETLVWDDGPPWELSLRVEFSTEREVWKLHGELRREETRLPIQEPLLLVPGGLVLTRAAIARLNDFDAFPWVSLLRRPDLLEVPAGEEHDLVDRLLDMPALPRLELPDALQLDEVSLAPRARLLIHAPAKSRWQQDRLKAEVHFVYDDVVVRGSSARWAIVQRSQNRCVLRDRDSESNAWTQLQDAGFRRLLDQRRGQFDVELPSRDLAAAVRALIRQDWEVRAEGKQVRQPADLRFQVRSGIDWFELHAAVDFEGHQVAFPELLSALSRGDSTIILDDGSLGILPEDWISRYGLLAGLGVSEEDHLRFSAVQAGLLDALLSTQGTVDYDSRFEELRAKLAAFAGIQPHAEPQTFRGELRQYQREGLGWLHFLEDFQFGGCLADDMGLGKTIQVLALLDERRDQKNPGEPSLVVVPKSLLFNWRQEAERFTPKLKVLEYSGLDRARSRDRFTKHDLILTTYGTLRRDVLILKEIQFDYVILDEAQAVKNAGSQVAKSVRLLKSRHRVALSGTPIENHLGDLCSIFDFLNPGMLGRSSLFKLHAASAEDKETRRILAEGLRPLILRRTKQSVASELPEKIEQTIYCEMRETQQSLYDELKEHYRVTLLGLIAEQGMAQSKMHVLEALLRLRQAACHPALLHRGGEEESSAKLDALVPLLEELIAEGHKALVFSQFTSMLAIVRRHLDDKQITYEYLDGQTRDRKERVEHFQNDPQCGIFLISLKAGGLGLNLTAADYVFILDPWWNPAVETQAIDRAHRVGQQRQVFAYRLICRNTVEEKIAELQQQKRELADAILEQDSTVLQSLTTDDLKLLLS